MALTQVRAKLGEEWVVLTYNETTGRYEGTLTPSATSYHQPGGYYPVAVEADNDSGETASISGDVLPALRLTVRETAAPALALVSPPAGYLTTATPRIVWEATDEEGGSGVDPDSFTPEGAEVEEIDGGYRFTWTPPGPWEDGPHTVSVSVSDYDGNQSGLSVSYFVDTVPPVVILRSPDAHRVVDVDSVRVAVEVWDGGSGVGDVRTDPPATGTVLPAPVGSPGQLWAFDLPLEIGENRIPVTVTDRAGNVTTAEVYMIRLVTDRTPADRAVLSALYERPVAQWTAEELEWFLTAPCLRGAYTAEDMNRVGTAVSYLAGELRGRGYIANVRPKTDWTDEDAPTISQGQTYRDNVEAVRTAQPVYIPVELPLTIRWLTVDGANALEKALVEADSVLPRYTWWTCGEITCGEA